MRVAIYTNYNGYGLQKDAAVIGGIMENKGYDVLYQPIADPVVAEVSYHLEIPCIEGIKKSGYSYFYPNLEWLLANPATMFRFKGVLCKTKHALPAVARYARKARYTGFTSMDMWSPLDSGRVLECIHIQGNSDAKNTDKVVKTWEENPDLPLLHLFTAKGADTSAHNIKVYHGYVTDKEIKYMLNKCLIAVFPSAVEGFGQALWESLSAGCIVITVNAPPMNEIPTAVGIPAYDSGNRMRQEILWGFAEEDLATAVRRVVNLKPSKLADWSSRARAEWKESHNNFIRRLSQS